MTLLGVGRIRGRRAKGEEGQALVEFALVLPFLLLIVTAIIEFGFLFEKYLTLTDAARSGAQTLALGRSLTDPCDPAVTQTVNDSDGLISLPAAEAGAVTTTLTGGDTCGTGSYPNRTGGSETSGNEVTVSATDPYTLTVLGLGIFSLTLKASASDAVQ